MRRGSAWQLQAPAYTGSTCSLSHVSSLCERVSEDEPHCLLGSFLPPLSTSLELAKHMARGLGDQALTNLLSCPPEQHVPQLEQFERFMLGQRTSASEARSHEVAESTSKTHNDLLREKARNDALNRTVETLSVRSIRPRPIRMDPPRFDRTAVRIILHRILPVNQCGVAQLIKEDTRMASYAMSHLRGKASEWAYSALMVDGKSFLS